MQGDFATAFGNLPQTLYYLVMPAIAVAFYSLSRNARLVRSSMLEVLGQDYVRTARSKGLSERAVVVHHALRNAWLPVVTMIGLEFGFLLGRRRRDRDRVQLPRHRPAASSTRSTSATSRWCRPA